MKYIIVILLLIGSLSVNAQNYLFVGIDSRNPDVNERANADMIAVLSITKSGMNLASIMRDTRVAIPGHGNDKINASFRYGNEKLLIQTLNNNFDLKIKNYVVVDFINAPKAVDSIGGVVVNVDEDERIQMNKYITEQNITNKTKYSQINKTGELRLNGGQALAYCRVRIDGDRSRTGRQQEVFNYIIKYLRDKYEFKTIMTLYSLFKTDIPIEVGLKILDRLAAKKVGVTTATAYPISKTFPLEQRSKVVKINKVSYLVTDIESTKNDLKQFLNK